MCDKWKRKHNIGGASFVKIITRWYGESKKVRVTCISIEVAGKLSADTSEGIYHTLKCMVMKMVEYYYKIAGCIVVELKHEMIF